MIDPELASLGAREAIPRLLDRYGARIFRLGVRVCGNEDEASDLLQDIFLAAFRHWDQFEGRARPTTWLYTIAVRACQRRHRLRAGEPQRIDSLEELLPAPGAEVAMVPEEDDPRAALLRREVAETVDRAVAGLPIAYRLPLVLKELAELSVAEVGEVLGLKQATVKTRLHRARLHLRRELESVLPHASLPAPDHAREICLDLLHAKQEALDRGVPFPVATAELCSRCQALFSTLDLAHDTCRHLGSGELPSPVRRLLLDRIAAAS